MGTGASRNTDGDGSNGDDGKEGILDHAGGQFYVSLKMEKIKLKGDLIPHVYGSVPLVGSWDSSKAVTSLHLPSSFLFCQFYNFIICCSFEFE